MSNFMVGLWESIFTPGASPALLIATNVAFAALQVVLLVLIFIQFSVHWLVLSVLCGGLWWSINWFVAELAVHQAKEEEEERQKRDRDAPSSSSSDSETEVEGAAPVPKPSKKTGGTARSSEPPVAVVPPPPEAAAQPVESTGEMRKRGGGGVGSSLAPADDNMTQSSVSTEDEWEKVSESEDKK